MVGPSNRDTQLMAEWRQGNLNLSHNKVGTKFKRLNELKMPTTTLDGCYPEITEN